MENINADKVWTCDCGAWNSSTRETCGSCEILHETIDDINKLHIMLLKDELYYRSEERRLYQLNNTLINKLENMQQ
jgi:hypothetical protein